MDDNHLNQILKNQLEGFEASPSEEAWGNIHQELKRDRKIVFHQRLSTLIVVLSLAATIFLLLRPPLSQNNDIADRTEKTVKEGDRSDIQKTDRSNYEIAEKSDLAKENKQLPVEAKNNTEPIPVDKPGSSLAEESGNLESSQPDQLSEGPVTGELNREENTAYGVAGYFPGVSVDKIQSKKPGLSMFVPGNKKTAHRQFQA